MRPPRRSFPGYFPNCEGVRNDTGDAPSEIVGGQKVLQLADPLSAELLSDRARTVT